MLRANNGNRCSRRLLEVIRRLAKHIVYAWLLALSAALPATAADAPPEGLIASLTVNSVPRGESALLMTADRDFWILLSSFDVLGLKGPAGVLAASPAARQRDGLTYLSLATLSRNRLRFDEKNLVLEVTLPPELFGEQAFYSQDRAAPAVRFRKGDGAFVNYFVTASQSFGGPEGTDNGVALRLDNELGAYVGPAFFRHETAYRRDGGTSSFSRVATQVIFDHVPSLSRLTLGDAFVVTGALGSSMALGGIAWGTYFPMSPQLIRSPLASVLGSVETPSIVDVSVGGLPVTRQRVAPGAFEIRNIAYYGGARNLEISVTEANGRVRRFEVPYYFSDNSLRQGLHEFSYAVGKIRSETEGGDGNPRYGAGSALAYHQYGFTDSITAGARLEAAAQFAGAGINASYRSDSIGYFAADVGVSRESRRDRRGHAIQLSYAYQASSSGVRVALRKLSPDYRPLSSLTDLSADVLSPASLQEWRVTGYLNPLPALFMSADVTRVRDAARAYGMTTSLNATYRFSPLVSITASVRNGNEPGLGHTTEGFLGLLFSLDNQSTASVSHRQSGEASSSLASYNRAAPVGEGTGYRLDASHDRIDQVSTSRLQPHLQVNTPWAIISSEGLVEKTDQQPVRSNLSISAAGGLTLVGGKFSATRPIYDSFGLVELGVPLAGVRVYLNNQPVGTTDASGSLYIPSLSSFQENQVRLDHRDIPLQYAVARVDQAVIPAFRAGVRIPFGLYRARAVAGRIVARQAGRAVALPPQRVMIRTANGDKAMSIESGGDFYVEGVAPGRYRIDARIADAGCGVDLVVPDSADVYVELKEALICE